MTHDVYTISVTTDYSNKVFEFTNENNNDRRTYVTIIQSLPDLSAEKFNVSVDYQTNLTQLMFTWHVENIGEGGTLATSWTDSVYIQTAPSSIYILLIRRQVSEESRLGSMGEYSVSASVVLPFTVYGNLAFKVVVDEKDVTGDKDVTSNTKIVSPVSVQLRAIDLKVTAARVTNEDVQAGSNMYVTYTVQNVGNMDADHLVWTDMLTLSSPNGPNMENVIKVEVIQNLSLIAQNMSYTNTVEMFVPFEWSGSMSLVIAADYQGTIFEGHNTDNNQESVEVYISPARSVDLMVSNVGVTVANYDEKLIAVVDWMVENVGNSMSEVPKWTDAVLYKKVGKDPIALNQFTFQYVLESQSSYQTNRHVVLPSEAFGELEICVHADFSGKLFEAGSILNNLKCSSVVNIVRKASAVLSSRLNIVADQNVSQSLKAGDFVEVEFIIINTGDLPTSQTAWIDSIYMTSVDIGNIADLKISGTKLKDIVHIGRLQANEQYTVTTSIQIPLSFSGSPRIYVVSNNKDSDEYTGTDDDTTEISEPSVLPQPVEYVLPNLQISSEFNITDMFGGQPVTIPYTIYNVGNVSAFGVWYDAVYLSDDLVLDAFDIKVKNKKRSFIKLAPNESVLTNISFTLPLDLQTKLYMLVIAVDSRDDIFEDNESDNDVRMTFKLEARTTTDIAVSLVTAPRSTLIGQQLHITWNLVNNGTKHAKGHTCDSVYLSEDIEWDILDMQIGKPVCTPFELGANSSTTLELSITSETPPVKANDYNALVKSRTNVIDINLENNVAVDPEKTRVSYSDLTLDIPLTLEITGYRQSTALRVPYVTDDKTIIIRVMSDRKLASNNVYVKYGSPATLYSFEYSSNNPLVADQVVTVPNTIKGDYYMLIESDQDETQYINITAKYAELEIIEVSPKFMIPGSQTTLKIEGTLFTPDMNVRIENADNSDTVYTAVNSYVFSSTVIFATFELTDDALMGSYMVIVISELKNVSTTYSNVLLKKGTLGYITSTLEKPTRLRVGETGTVVVKLFNGGDSDLPVPILNIKAVGDGSFQLQDNTRVEFFRQQYQLYCISKEGPAGLLRPKQLCELEFTVKQTVTDGPGTMSLQVAIQRSDKASPNPYLALKNNLRPSHYSENQWDKIWSNFEFTTGPTAESLVNKMAAVLNEMSVAGRRVRPVDDVLKFLLSHADVPHGDKLLDVSADIEQASKTNIRLIVDRFMPSNIGTRTRDGVLGKGWILPLW